LREWLYRRADQSRTARSLRSHRRNAAQLIGIKIFRSFEGDRGVVVKRAIDETVSGGGQPGSSPRQLREKKSRSMGRVWIAKTQPVRSSDDPHGERSSRRFLYFLLPRFGAAMRRTALIALLARAMSSDGRISAVAVANKFGAVAQKRSADWFRGGGRSGRIAVRLALVLLRSILGTVAGQCRHAPHQEVLLHDNIFAGTEFPAQAG
jgi:hypothetical protein